MLEVGEKGFGFLRNPAKSFQISPSDIYVSPDVIRRHKLRSGLDIEGRRAELGAHYTSRTDIETIVEPVLMLPEIVVLPTPPTVRP